MLLEASAVDSGTLAGKRKRQPSDFEVCWGSILSGGASVCEVVPPKGGAFREKFCARCRQRGVLVPVTRVRVPVGTAELSNQRTAGVWNSPSRAVPWPDYRIINQTADCTGPILVILRNECSVRLPNLAPLPSLPAVTSLPWPLPGFITFRVSRTLVPMSPLPWSFAVEAEQVAAAATARDWAREGMWNGLYGGGGGSARQLPVPAAALYGTSLGTPLAPDTAVAALEDSRAAAAAAAVRQARLQLQLQAQRQALAARGALWSGVPSAGASLLQLPQAQAQAQQIAAVGGWAGAAGWGGLIGSLPTASLLAAYGQQLPSQQQHLPVAATSAAGGTALSQFGQVPSAVMWPPHPQQLAQGLYQPAFAAGAHRSVPMAPVGALQPAYAQAQLPSGATGAQQPDFATGPS